MHGAAFVDERPVSEMNTTPLIDVMLVLLIMFIIAIPVQRHSVPIELPGPPDVIVERERNSIGIDRQGNISWNGRPVPLQALPPLLQQVRALPEQSELHVVPHAEARYETVGEVVAAVKRADIRAMGLIGNDRYASF